MTDYVTCRSAMQEKKICEVVGVNERQGEDGQEGTRSAEMIVRGLWLAVEQVLGRDRLTNCRVESIPPDLTELLERREANVAR